MKELVAIPKNVEYDGESVTTSKDIQTINAKLVRDKARWGGLRVKTAFFRVPWPLTKAQYEQYRKTAVDKWVMGMEKQGWTLKSKVAMDTNKRRPATDWAGDWAIPKPGEVEIPVAAIFLKEKVKARKIEVPVGPA